MDRPIEPEVVPDEPGIEVVPLSTIIVPERPTITLQISVIRLLNPHSGKWHEVIMVRKE